MSRNISQSKMPLFSFCTSSLPFWEDTVKNCGAVNDCRRQPCLEPFGCWCKLRPVCLAWAGAVVYFFRSASSYIYTNCSISHLLSGNIDVDGGPIEYRTHPACTSKICAAAPTWAYLDGNGSPFVPFRIHSEPISMCGMRLTAFSGSASGLAVFLNHLNSFIPSPLSLSQSPAVWPQ